MTDSKEPEFMSFADASIMLKEELKFPEERANYYVKKFDKNGDGKLSVAEFHEFKRNIEETKEKLIPIFKQYDNDNNGYVTLDEANDILQKPPFNFPSGRVVVLLKKFDRDGNGKLDIEEFADFYAEAKTTMDDISKRFDELDVDKNGVLSPEEVSVIIQQTLGFDADTATCMVDMFDQNKDGSLDKKEFMQMWTSMFS